MAPDYPELLSPRHYDAVIFDLDGVITDTAKTHFAAWKEVFDELLERQQGELRRPFSESDYRQYVDGKPRFDGIRSFLDSRTIELPEGDPSNPPGYDSVFSVGMEKNRRYRQRLDAHEITVFDDSVDVVHRLKQRGFKLAIVSSSRNAELVLETLDLASLFDVRVDGVTLAQSEMAGKPQPDMFLEAARRLHTRPRRAVVVEDAESGVEAGRAGEFGLVVGLADTEEKRRRLLDFGADVAVETLSQLKIE